MAKERWKRRENHARNRMDLRADPEWVARVTRQAKRLGIGVAAYVRMATTERLERDEATEPPPKRPPQ